MCPSHGLTLSPRQRIVSWRELSRRAAAGEDASDVEADFVYDSLNTCAGCGLCSTACPVDINTGDLTRLLRGRKLGAASLRIGEWTVGNFGKVATAARAGLAIGHAVSAVVGDGALARLSAGAWKRGMPRAGTLPAPYKGAGDPVVYFPACGGRIFGANSPDEASLADVVIELLVRAGYAPRLPEGFDKLCCGQMLESKGMADAADQMADNLTEALLKAADDGHGGFYPVIIDASTCSLRMKQRLAGRLPLYDFHEFAHDALLPRLRIMRKPGPVALHVNCSVRRTGSGAKLRKRDRGLRGPGRRAGRRSLLRLCRRPRLRRPRTQRPRPAQYPRSPPQELLRGRLHQPHLRDRPHRRNRPPLPFHRIFT